jgi:phosphatidylinositol kinase/protein kinase (PI-3  family)
LGVGDRHLDNLLLAPDGKHRICSLFQSYLALSTYDLRSRPLLPWYANYLPHPAGVADFQLSVDFGFIFGRDPKPFPPPVKVCKEMVDGMGGAGSAHYARFKNLCFTAFTILRKSANLFLNLVALMVDANIPDIKHRDVHEQIQDKFRLDLTEEEAIKHFETLLDDTSYFTVLVDRIHDLRQYWRS